MYVVLMCDMLHCLPYGCVCACMYVCNAGMFHLGCVLVQAGMLLHTYAHMYECVVSVFSDTQ